MRDHRGIEWLTYPEAARRARVREDLIRQWVARGKVDSHRVGRRTFVRLTHVLTCELQWRRRARHAENAGAAGSG